MDDRRLIETGRKPIAHRPHMRKPSFDDPRLRFFGQRFHDERLERPTARLQMAAPDHEDQWLAALGGEAREVVGQVADGLEINVELQTQASRPTPREQRESSAGRTGGPSADVLTCRISASVVGLTPPVTPAFSGVRAGSVQRVMPDSWPLRRPGMPTCQSSVRSSNSLAIRLFALAPGAVFVVSRVGDRVRAPTELAEHPTLRPACVLF